MNINDLYQRRYAYVAPTEMVRASEADGAEIAVLYDNVTSMVTRIEHHDRTVYQQAHSIVLHHEHSGGVQITMSGFPSLLSADGGNSSVESSVGWNSSLMSFPPDVEARVLLDVDFKMSGVAREGRTTVYTTHLSGLLYDRMDSTVSSAVQRYLTASFLLTDALGVVTDVRLNTTLATVDSVIVSGVHVWEFENDNDGRLSEVRHYGQFLRSFEYIGSRLTSTMIPNGHACWRSYDNGGHLVEMAWKDEFNVSMSRYRSTYDTNSLPVRVTTEHALASGRSNASEE